MIFPTITSSGRTGIERRFSIVPRSRSRVIASAVIMIIVIVRTTPIRPGTMLYWVIASGLNFEWMTRSAGPGVPASPASGPVRSRSQTPLTSVWIAETALPVAAGSVASASRRICGRSPRRNERVKSGGIVSTNWTLPSASASRADGSSSRPEIAK